MFKSNRHAIQSNHAIAILALKIINIILDKLINVLLKSEFIEISLLICQEQSMSFHRFQRSITKYI